MSGTERNLSSAYCLQFFNWRCQELNMEPWIESGIFCMQSMCALLLWLLWTIWIVPLVCVVLYRGHSVRQVFSLRSYNLRFHQGTAKKGSGVDARRKRGRTRVPISSEPWSGPFLGTGSVNNWINALWRGHFWSSLAWAPLLGPPPQGTCICSGTLQRLVFVPLCMILLAGHSKDWTGNLEFSKQ